LGQCPKLHSQKLKDDYENAVTQALKAMNDPKEQPAYSVKELEGLKREYERNIMSFVEECDRRIRAAQRRLEKTPEENNKTTNLMREIGEIETAYQLAMQAVEQLGQSLSVASDIPEAETIRKQVNLARLTNPWRN
jgi:archaellum component FlaC